MVKRVPQRTCVGCRTVRPKKELVRVVRTPEGTIMVDWTGKASGRGAYLCHSVECLDAAVQRRQLERALNCGALGNDVVKELREKMGTLA